MNYNLLPSRTPESIRVSVTDDRGRLLVTHVVALADADTWEQNTIASLDATDLMNGLDPATRTHTVLRQLKSL